MSLVEKCWMVTSKISVIALLMITGIYFGKFVCPYIKKKKGAVAVSIVYITIMLVLYMIPPQIDNFSASCIRKWTVGSIYTDRYTFIVRKGGWCYVRNQKF